VHVNLPRAIDFSRSQDIARQKKAETAAPAQLKQNPCLKILPAQAYRAVEREIDHEKLPSAVEAYGIVSSAPAGAIPQ
jgi:hypothetical protein